MLDILSDKSHRTMEGSTAIFQRRRRKLPFDGKLSLRNKVLIRLHCNLPGTCIYNGHKSNIQIPFGNWIHGFSCRIFSVEFKALSWQFTCHGKGIMKVRTAWLPVTMAKIKTSELVFILPMNDLTLGILAFI